MLKRRIAVDNCTLVALTTKCETSYTPDVVEKLEHLQDMLSAKNVMVVIPAPVIAEYLAYHSEAELESVLDSPHVMVLPFDQCAAEMAAEIEKKLKSNGVVKALSSPLNSKQVAKIDRQVLAICMTNGVSSLITDDKGLLSMCNCLGFSAQSFRTLALPEERKQMKLGLAQAED